MHILDKVGFLVVLEEPGSGSLSVECGVIVVPVCSVDKRWVVCFVKVR